MSRATEAFGRIPNRLLTDVAAGELSVYGLALLVYFECTTNFKTGVWTGKTSRIEDELQWPFKRRQLLGELARLRDAGYIAGGPTPRSPKAYQVRLLRARPDGGHGARCSCDACLGFV